MFGGNLTWLFSLELYQFYISCHILPSKIFPLHLLGHTFHDKQQSSVFKSSPSREEPNHSFYKSAPSSAVSWNEKGSSPPQVSPAIGWGFLFIHGVFLFCLFVLERNCFTMLCYFLPFSEVNQLCIHVSPPSWTYLPPTSPIPLSSHHQAELPVLYSSFPLALYFYMVVYICQS